MTHAEALRQNAAKLKELAETTMSGGVLTKAINDMLEAADALDIINEGLTDIRKELRDRM